MAPRGVALERTGSLKLFVAALVLRVIYRIELGSSPLVKHVMGDGKGYDALVELARDFMLENNISR